MPHPLDPLRRGEFAPPPRTLVEIFRETAAQAADEPAVDAGTGILTYAELEEAADELAVELATLGVGRGDKVGVRIQSGTTDLYVAILGIMLAGAAYVPVDADDPDERARLVFGEADVAAIVGNDLVIAPRVVRPPRPEIEEPDLTDDAWVIFTSGSTGRPKGVAVNHRSAAAFVDAESRMFLQGDALGVGDRVMAGLSVAFDASCEEMWLAWRYGGCLVPAPRALVRSGVEVGPWLRANQITVVSTVPTLVAMWPTESLERVRLLIMGGEACPPELVTRLVQPGREVWNTYGPTEATVVACGALLTGEGPVRIGLPLDGWDLEVVDTSGIPVKQGETGELIIGGVGLARYLDSEKDAEKYAAMPTLGWPRAYRSGDLVVRDDEGLLFGGRADDQIKLGGRRIELGEIDSALLGLPGVVAAAAAVQRTAAGVSVLVGYLAVDAHYDQGASLQLLRTSMPAALVPRLAVVDTIPTGTSGKVDRKALPWPPPPPPRRDGEAPRLTDTETWVAELWLEVLGAAVEARDADFFDLGGGSLSAAQLVSRLRTRHPEVVVGDLYAAPTLGRLSAHLDGMAKAGPAVDRSIPPTPIKTQVGQVAATVALRCLAAPRWLFWIAFSCWVLSGLDGLAWLPQVSLAWLLALGLIFIAPPGRMLLAAALARALTAPCVPGEHPRGGKIHLRLWLASQTADALGATSLSGAPFMTWYARLLGAQVGRNVDLHSLPPVTGLLTLGRGCSIEPEVDLCGYWIDGDVLRLGEVRVGQRVRVGARSMLLPGTDIGADAEIGAGSAVFGTVPTGEFWFGSPAEAGTKRARGPWDERPGGSRLWIGAYVATAVYLASLPVVSIAMAAAVPLLIAERPSDVSEVLGLLWWLPIGALLGFLVLTALVWGTVRLAGKAIAPGVHPILSGRALAVWTTMRVLDEARDWLFPLYSSSLTPVWLRALGAKIGTDVEASTVLMIPSLTQVNAEAFLADDTLIGGYELGGGWLRVERVKIGKRAFVGNSGMAAPGRRVPKASLVAVLSAAPQRKTARSGESWLGSPPAPLRRTAEPQTARTFRPTTRLRVARAVVEAGRLIPLTLSVLLYAGSALAVLACWQQAGPLVALLAVGPILVMAGLVAAVSAVAAKWILIGRLRPGSHPLWSSFVWRNELADTFIETVAAPWFARAVSGTPLLNVWLRLLGAKVGRGVWCDSYWLPEADLVTLGDGATVNPGSVVQTHRFHDRLFSMDTVHLKAGATLGPNSVILPAAVLGRSATVGPVSLVMRGESVPAKTWWIGNPIGPWDQTS